MNSRADHLQPPRIAVWLVNLFSPAEEAESILGDLLEEFSHLASESGAAFARNWYWRQALKTSAHLFGTGFRLAPWSIIASVVGGFLLIRILGGLPGHAVAAALHRCRVYERHYDAYILCLKGGMLIGNVIVSVVVGGIVAFAVKGSEMTVSVTLGLARAALAVVTTVLLVAIKGGGEYLWTLPWSLAFSIATVAGGVVVRMRRSTTTIGPSVA